MRLRRSVGGVLDGHDLVSEPRCARVLGGKARSASKSCFRRSTDGGDGLAAPPGPTAAFGGGARRSGALRSAARF